MSAESQQNSQLLPAVSSFLSSPKQLLIDGEWVDSKEGQTFDTVNPATEEVLVKVARASAIDADRAVVAARNAFEAGSPWPRMTPRERSHLLWRIGDLIDEKSEELAQLESLDNGKSLASARGDVGVAAELFRYFAGWATKMEGTSIPMSVPGREFHAYTRREAIGAHEKVPRRERRARAIETLSAQPPHSSTRVNSQTRPSETAKVATWVGGVSVMRSTLSSCAFTRSIVPAAWLITGSTSLSSPWRNDESRPTVPPRRTSRYVSPRATSTKNTLSAIQRASIGSNSASGIAGFYWEGLAERCSSPGCDDRSEARTQGVFVARSYGRD